MSDSCFVLGKEVNCINIVQRDESKRFEVLLNKEPDRTLLPPSTPLYSVY